jgi:hypothetical protein
VHIFNLDVLLIESEIMSCQEGETCSIRKIFPDEGDSGGVSLKNIPLKERRKEAGKPLFLKRYE